MSTKAAKKTTVKKGGKKIAPKAKVAKANSKGKPTKDDARAVAKASGGKLDTDQVRVLRALASPGQKKELTRGDLKEAVGIGREGKYSSKWLNSLWDLAEKGFIVTPEYEGERCYYHAITAKGKKALEQSEQAYKKLST
jgi:DNA-binding MarR family transcriptional regulator